MTDDKILLQRIMEKVELVGNTLDQIDLMTTMLKGIEVHYKGNHAVVDTISAMGDFVDLIVKYENGDQWIEEITLVELYELL